MEKEEKILSVKRSIVIILLASFLIDIVLVFFSIGFRYNLQSIFPRTIPIISLLFFSIILIGLSLYWITKWGIKFDEFFLVCTIFTLVCLAFWHFAPNSFKLIEANYYAVSTASVNQVNEITFSSSHSGKLYYKNDQAIKDEITKLKGKSNETAFNIDSFLFWQSGLLFGHSPLKIDQYDGFTGFANKAKLFLTVGPLSLLESFLRALTMYFPIGLILVSTINFKQYRSFEPRL